MWSIGVENSFLFKGIQWKTQFLVEVHHFSWTLVKITSPVLIIGMCGKNALTVLDNRRSLKLFSYNLQDLNKNEYLCLSMVQTAQTQYLQINSI